MIDNFFPLYVLIFLFSFLITAVMVKKLIPALRKRASQPIYTDGPKWHEKKSGTPTLGGIAFLFALLISVIPVLPAFKESKGNEALISLFITLLYAASNALVGIYDDLKKLHRKKNQGLKPIQKLILQTILALLFLYLRHRLLGDNTSISFAFGEINLGFWYYPLSLLILIGIINCANLTDGIDGLATSVAFSIGISLLYLSAALVEEVAVLSSAIIGISVGFLIFNLHPAKIFMGDTGSLFFGALVAGCTFALRNPLLSLLVGIVYVIEGISVILQVISFKTTRKRIFKMAPIHHHLEQCGWSENKICIVAILITFICSVPMYIFYLP